jgi:hypothetical protein
MKLSANVAASVRQRLLNRARSDNPKTKHWVAPGPWK